ncbi:MAG: flippase [Zetaproteobacteria bacterium]|nr:flippase [Zetaproteobacteria bacterium]
MLHKRSIKEKLLKGGAWAFSGKIITAFIGLSINALLARLLPPDELGAYFLTFSIVSLAAIFAQFGLTKSTVRLVAESMGTERQGRARAFITTSLRICTLTSFIIVCLLVFGAGEWIAKQLFESELISQVMGLAPAWVVIIVFQQLMAEVFRGFHDIRLAILFGGLVTGLIAMFLFFTLWLLQGYSNLSQIIQLMLIAGISSIIISSLLLWKKLSILPLQSDDKINIPEIISLSWPLWITSLTFFVLIQVDLWIMGAFRPQEEVAVYGAVTRTVALVTMPLLIVNAVVPPLIAEMYAQGKTEQLEKAIRTVSTLAGFPSLIILVCFLIFGESLLGMIFGEYYQIGGLILTILSVGQLTNVWVGSCGQVLMLTGHQVIMMRITVFSGMFAAISAFFLVSKYGGVGVAIASSSGMILQNLLMLFFAKKSTGIWTHVSFSKLDLKL